MQSRPLARFQGSREQYIFRGANIFHSLYMF